MRRINIKQVHQEKAFYTVFLGNGTTHAFKSKRKCQNFLNTTNQFLTEHLHELHSIYSDVSIKYNHNWFYFRNDKPTSKHDLYQFERDCNTNMDAIRSVLSRTVGQSHFINGNYRVFTDFNKVSNYLKDTIKILNNISETRSNTNALYEYKSLYNRLIQLDNTLSSYSQFQSVKSFKVPDHISEYTAYNPILNIA